MADDQSAWIAVAKWIGGSVSFAGLYKLFSKARSINHTDRIIRVENQNKELRRVMNQAVEQLNELASTVDIDRGDSHRRFQRVESDIRTIRRETRDKLLEIADTLGEQLNRSTPGQQEQPPTQR